MKAKYVLIKITRRKNTTASPPKQPVTIRWSQHAATPANAGLAEAFGAWARGHHPNISAKRDGLAVQRRLRAEWDQ